VTRSRRYRARTDLSPTRVGPSVLVIVGMTNLTIGQQTREVVEELVRSSDIVHLSFGSVSGQNELGMGEWAIRPQDSGAGRVFLWWMGAGGRGG